MDIVVERCAGLDVHKDTVVACVRSPAEGRRREQEIVTFGTTTVQLLALRDWLVSMDVTLVGMESTGVYWKPVYYVLEDAIECWLLNAQHLRNVPGRKTDVADAAWICQLVEHGLVRPSFVPPRPIRELRSLCRYRRSQIEERTREAQRLDKVLQDAGIKLSSVATRILGLSGRAMLDALVAGTRDPEVLAELAKGTLRKKIPQLRDALEGRFGAHHGLLIGQILAKLDFLDEAIANLSAEIDRMIAPFETEVALLVTTPGIERRSAQELIAEIGVDMTRFPQQFRIRFFDLFADPVNPPLLATYVPSFLPHEMFLWIDPKDADRALLWLSTPTTSVNPSRPNLIITDISRAREQVFTEIATGNWNQLFPGAADAVNYDFDLAVHSMAPSFDGTRTYLAYLRGGFGVLDTSRVANNQIPAGTVESLNDDLLTGVPLPTWGAGNQCAGHTVAGCAESHSAVPLPGRPFALTTDEVYGTFTVPSFGWPWGWARLWNVAQPSRPHILGEYKIFENTQAFQGAPADDATTEATRSYSSHNPTLTRNLALIAGHSGGLQAIDISDPGQPVQAGWFTPTPEATVATEDPALSTGTDARGNKVVMWSYPIIKDGLVYVVDIRNGLYVLRYNGAAGGEVNGLTFLEGNSNLGDAGRLDKAARPSRP